MHDNRHHDEFDWVDDPSVVMYCVTALEADFSKGWC
ncbi:hypothetical protein YIM_23335 [Amycolatopsis sp. YIM 10]|nr:hypothetical protein YIM_23335 [Amycolatopsis sp. YIM 10]